MLPGAAYPASMPLLWCARASLVEHGYDVVAAEWDGTPARAMSDEDADAWVRERALAAAGGEPVDLVVAKSLGTRASALVAAWSATAIWLTPLLTLGSCVEGIRANPARQLLVGGLVDDLWDADVAASLHAGGCDVLEVADADHAMSVEGAAVRTAEILHEATRGIEEFLRSCSS